MNIPGFKQMKEIIKFVVGCLNNFAGVGLKRQHRINNNACLRTQSEKGNAKFLTASEHGSLYRSIRKTVHLGTEMGKDRLSDQSYMQLSAS